jgi:hypothetical protein
MQARHDRLAMLLVKLETGFVVRQLELRIGDNYNCGFVER